MISCLRLFQNVELQHQHSGELVNMTESWKTFNFDCTLWLAYSTIILIEPLFEINRGAVCELILY